MPAKTSLRDRDFFAWSLEQAALLREGRLAEADLEAIAEEIESMGKTEKRELCQPSHGSPHASPQMAHRGKSWRLTIANARDDFADHLETNPSLEGMLDRAMEQAYGAARRKAAIETELDEDDSPQRSRWTFAEAKDPGFWPE